MNHQSSAAQGGWLMRMLPGGVRARLFLLISLALLPALLLLVWIYYQRYQSQLFEARQTEMEVAQGVATTFAAYIEGIQQQNYAVGQAILTYLPYNQAKAVYLLSHAAQYPAVRNLSWLNPEGKVLASSLPALTGRDLSIRLYFQEIQAGHPWAIGDLLPQGAATKAPTVGIATAIRDEGGALRGVIVAGVEPTRLHELTLTQQRPAGSEYAIFDRQGVVVYSSSGTALTWEERTRWRTGDTLLQRALESGAPQVGITSLEIPGGEWIAARVPVAGAGWVAGGRRSVASAIAPIRRGLLLDGLLALLVFALAFLLATMLAGTISRPLLRLGRDALAMGAGEIQSDPDPQAPAEVRSLRSTVERMAAGLIQQAEALREAHDSLHETHDSLSEAHDSLRESHDRAAWLARFPDENPNPVVRASAGGILLYCNPASTQLPGWNFQVGQCLDEPLLSLVQEAMAQGAEVEQDVQLGASFYSVSAMPFPNEHYANLYGREISERKRAEDDLRETNQRIQHILESISDAFYSIDQDGYFTYVNQKTGSLWGMAPEELLGKNIWEVFPSGKGTESFLKMQQAMKDRQHLQYESYSAFLDQWVDINLYPTDWGLSVFFQDITERKQAEEALQAYARRLECSNRDLQEFAFMASHDLQEPLRKIEILGDIVLQRADDLDQRMRDALVRMRRAADRMRRMVDGLLQFSLSTAQGQAFGMVPLSQVIVEVLASLEFQILQVDGCVEVEPLPVIEANPAQMRQLFQNLIDNAIKFHKPGVPPVVKIYARGADIVGRTEFIQIFVEDNGIGFDESRARRLFQPFQRLVGRGDSSEPEYPGIGMGLPICRRIVEAHGGEIAAQAKPGQGTTILLKLPVRGSKSLTLEVGKIDAN